MQLLLYPIRRSISDLCASTWQIFIRVDEQCKVLCRIDSLKENQAKAFKVKVEDEYRVLMYAHPVLLFGLELGLSLLSL